MHLTVTCSNLDDPQLQFKVSVGEDYKMLDKKNPTVDFEILDKREYKVRVDQVPYNNHEPINIFWFALTAIFRSFYYLCMFYFADDAYKYKNMNPFYTEALIYVLMDKDKDIVFEYKKGRYDYEKKIINRPKFIPQNCYFDEIRWIFNRNAFRNILYKNIKKDISCGLLVEAIIIILGVMITFKTQDIVPAVVFGVIGLGILGVIACAIVHDFNKFTYACNTAGILKESIDLSKYK